MSCILPAYSVRILRPDVGVPVGAGYVCSLALHDGDGVYSWERRARHQHASDNLITNFNQ